jgi:hypothetical protein
VLFCHSLRPAQAKHVTHHAGGDNHVTQSRPGK